MAAPPFKVKSIYEYTSDHDDDLTFPIGQVISVTELEGDDWYVGEYTDASGSKQEGLFPTNFVERYEPEVPVRPSRSTRAKQELAQPAPPVAAPEPAADEPEEEQAPPLPAASKPAPPPVEVPAATTAAAEEARSPPSATRQPSLPIRQEPPAAPKPVPAEPAEPAVAAAKKPPPPVAAKSNAFKDRIAAFNQGAAAPVAPMQPGRKPEPNFIKKPFVAPPPSKNAYIPPVTKQEPVHKPYHREEDPEIKQREEEDRIAAEAAGLGGDQSTTSPVQAEDGDEDAPKPMTLKERMALLQKQQQEQAQRRAESAAKKEKKPPSKRPSESSEQMLSPEDDEETLERSRTAGEKKSMDVSQEMPPVPTSSRRPHEAMSPMPTGPEHDLSSDGHEADQSGAGEMTEDDTGTLGPDKDEIDERRTESLRHPVAPKAEPDMGDQQDTTEDDEDEEEEEMDEETRRKEELRARMARLGGGGLPGMGGQAFNPFGAPPPAPPRKKASKDRKASEDTPVSPPQRMPMVPVPGMGAQQRMQSPESDTTQRPRHDPDETPHEEEPPELPPPPKRASTIERGAPPPIPKDSRPLPPPPQQERSVPPAPSGGVTPRPPAQESRPVPPPPPAAAPMSPGPGSESDDEASMHAKRSSAEMSGLDTPLQQQPRAAAPPVPGSRDVSREVPPRPLQSPENKRTSYFNNEPASATSDKRASRVPPPIPGEAPGSPRPPPPPPPTQAPPSRRETMDERDDEGHVGSDYDGDYDTDIASSAKHKDALKASPHAREPSLTENIPAGEETPVSSPPPAPQAAAPRAVPPPPPQAAPRSRPSMDRPPPPVPAAQDAAADDEYDPYRYGAQQQRAVPPPPNAAPRAVPPVPPVQEPETLQEESSADELYAPPSPPRKSIDRAPPQAPPQAPISQAAPRASLDASRSLAAGRRSMEQGRPSGEHGGQIASELNLSTDTPWWTAEQPLPPNMQSRNGIDILSECEESSKSKRGGRKEVTKDIYILYMDYSQTVISARYDSQDPAEVHFEQRHEPPPARMRQDQLEAAWQRFGMKIADAAAQVGNSKKSASVGDESPASLPLTLIKAHSDALLPVGTRAYGALVYANLANASTMQYDEIRRGDILTLRNAKFEGHHGAMKSKYKADYGANHVAVVEEWDGTRRAVRGWEQGREKKGGVRSEKFRLGDLRSGEVRVWRVVGREWVGWDS